MESLPAVDAGALAVDLYDGLFRTSLDPDLANLLRLKRSERAADLCALELPHAGYRDGLVTGRRQRSRQLSIRRKGDPRRKCLAALHVRGCDHQSLAEQGLHFGRRI